MNVRAYAKINVGLRVMGTRGDGYHNIETIFHRIDLYDELTIERADRTLTISCDASSVPTDERNLCWKAAELLRSETGTAFGAAIRLTKKIPVGAGLGGGSSDAATVLTTLPKVWNVNVDPATLAAVALEIGSDVPFFLHTKSAYAEGRGERLSFVRFFLPYWIVVATPSIHVSTSWAYAELARHKKPRGDSKPFYDGASCRVASFADLMINDFEGIVFTAYPEIARVKKILVQCGADHALMSGSGSSVYGLFENESKARRAVDELAPGHFVSLTEPNFIPSF